MHFVIYCNDIENSAPLRAEHYPAHKAFLAECAKYDVKITLSGPLVQDDGETRCGSIIVIEAETRAAAENFHHADPFYKAGVWKSSAVTAMIRSQ
jgi:uncharacterized protein YciI